MRTFEILASRNNGRTFKFRTTIDAVSAPAALREYGCHLKGSERTVTTSKGRVLTAVPVSA